MPGFDLTRTRLEADEIRAARAAVDLADLIGATVRLTPRGAEFLGLCPFHAEKTPSFTVVPAKGFYKCFGCGAKGSAIDWTMHVEGVGFRAAVDLLLARQARRSGDGDRPASATAPRPDTAGRARKRRAAWRLWSAARPITEGDPVSRYLQGRFCLVTPVPAVLRFHPALSHPEFLDPITHRPLRTWPGLVARVDCRSGTFAGIHRTYLAASGSAIVQDPDLQARKLAKLSLGSLVGGAIRLSPMTHTVGVAEGIEDALSAHLLTGLPVWSCVDNGKLMRVELPLAIPNVAIFADRDPPQTTPGKLYAPEGVGLRAARQLAARLRAEGRAVRIYLPSGERHDFNDELVARRDELALPAP
jgi:DNA primase